ncbi:MAG: ATP-binding cassette domain-containing protein [Lachnospiraceae bacterium]
MSETIVQINNLVKRYGNLLALDHFNLTIQEGEIFGLLGPNGSGKTTAINCLLSLLSYDKGTIQIFGKPMLPDSYESKRNIGVIFQNVAVFEELTVFENINYFCSLYIADKKKCREMTEEAIAFVGLEEFTRFYPKKLSGGLLRRLNIACGIAHKPRLIIMDEPTVAVDPQSRNKILEGIIKLNQQGSTIIYTSHYMEEVEQICSRISIIDNGRNVAIGTKEELKAMIGTGEKISIETLDIPEQTLQELRGLRHVVRTDYENPKLRIYCENGSNNLSRILHFLDGRGVAYSKVYSEAPSLNDVFLEITGKQLRDTQ